MFKNEPLTDFTVASARNAMSQAMQAVEQKIAKGELIARPITDGREIASGQKFERRNPALKSQIVGAVTMASTETASAALVSVNAGKTAWEDTAPTTRAKIIKKAAALMRERKFALASLMVKEVGKSWAEADADAAEAIDFCEYYADEMIRLSEPRAMSALSGEENLYLYQPRGVVVVISPWNFPLAIACGMAVAALVAGNTCILKPAEQSSIIAYELAKILYEAGVPANAFAFVPGVGEEVGPVLTDTNQIDMVCFTGSRSVGLHLIKQASNTKPDQRSIKKVSAELGGKNAVIVDEDADLDDAIKGVIASAFGFAGQKCSACSRAIVVGSAYEPFMKRLVDAIGDIIVGDPAQASTFLGPVVDDEAQNRILNTIKQGKQSERLAFEGKVPDNGNFVPATIFRDVSTQSPLWREEIFGPVLCCRQAKSFDQALAEANDSQYALTGGVFSRSPQHLDLAKRKFKVGNLYLNRKITGALVYRQPFGGFKMSGVGSKAGGPDYLIQFMEPRTITENTLRRGFAPPTAS